MCSVLCHIFMRPFPLLYAPGEGTSGECQWFSMHAVRRRTETTTCVLLSQPAGKHCPTTAKEQGNPTLAVLQRRVPAISCDNASHDACQQRLCIHAICKPEYADCQAGNHQRFQPAAAASDGSTLHTSKRAMKATDCSRLLPARLQLLGERLHPIFWAWVPSRLGLTAAGNLPDGHCRGHTACNGHHRPPHRGPPVHKR